MHRELRIVLLSAYDLILPPPGQNRSRAMPELDLLEARLIAAGP